MKKVRKIGICMDHSSARIIEFTHEQGGSETVSKSSGRIESTFTHEEKGKSLHKSESLMHHKEQHEQAAYYKKLADQIKNYEEVILFGPTDAKMELFNTIKDNHLFAAIKMEVKQTDKLTENQQNAFVKAYFEA